MLLDILMLLAGALFLWFGADWIVDGASALARRFGVSELVIGLTVVAMGTSLPEFLVTAVAAFRGFSSLSLANVVGSNIFNLGLILGLMGLIRPIPTSRTLLFRDGSALLAVSALLLVLCLDLDLARWEGLVLLSCFVGYLLMLFRQSRLDRVQARAIAETLPGPRDFGLREALKLAAGVAAVGAGSQFMVEGASGVAQTLGVSEWVIGLTIVAAGTSLPELVTCLAASVKGRNDMLLGNLIGSDFFNFAGVLGLTCLLRPLEVAPSSLTNVGLAVGGILLTLAFIRTGWRIGRVEAGLLVAVGLLRWGLEFA